jgi:hypothetical protein
VQRIPFTFDVPKGWIAESVSPDRPFTMYRPPTNELVGLVVGPVVPIGSRKVRGLTSVPSTRDVLILLAEHDLKHTKNVKRGAIVELRNGKWPDMTVYHQTYSDLQFLPAVGEVEEQVDCFGVERNQLVRVLCVRAAATASARAVAERTKTALLESLRPAEPGRSL